MVHRKKAQVSEQDIVEFQRIADEMAERHAQAEAREFELGRGLDHLTPLESWEPQGWTVEDDIEFGLIER